MTTVANQNVAMAYFDDQPPLVLKVHFYDVRPDQLPQEHPFLTEIEALNAVAELNKNFNSFKIFFKYDGLDHFISDEFYEIDAGEGSPQPGNFDDFLFNNDYYTQGAVNIYSVHTISDNIAAYFKIGSNYPNFTSIVSRYSYIDNPEAPYVLTHEVGHNFNLAHTFHFDQACETCPKIVENVTRDINDVDCYNANTRGDRIIDTNATPSNMSISSNCEYIFNGELDDCDVPYGSFGLEPEVKNFMSYGGCQEEFTPGQVAHMRWYIELIDSLPEIEAIENYPVSVLYEPYKGEYFLAGPLPVDEDGRLNPPLFQYGFDYVFYDTSQAAIYNQPSDYNDTSFWYGSVVQSYDVNHNTPIEHTNHTAFKILQVDTNYPRMCYNNYNRAPTGGTLIKFLDGVPSGNVIITAQDSLQINNPNYIQDLDSGLYNIQKSYNDGTSDENMILKENN
ncbi:MAG: hypothetical protein ACJA2M_002625 [Polaribacter sp.]